MKAYEPRIEWRDPSALTPYSNNAKTHPTEQIDKIAASIAAFGFDQPIVVDTDGVMIKGHGRREASLRLGLDQVPVLVRNDLSVTEIKAARLADNRSAESPFDEEALRLEFEALMEHDFDLSLTAFELPEIEEIMAAGAAEQTGLTEDDAVPEAPEQPVTRPGDLWILGDHRLLCGDATDANDVARLLAGAKPHLMVSDPPYGISYDPGWRNEAGVASTRRTGKVANDDRSDWRQAWALFPGDVAYVWHAAVHAKTVADSLEACVFELRAQIIWAKPRFVLSRGHYHWQHEPCWYAVRKGAEAHWHGGRDQSTLWEITTGVIGDRATVHGTQKPVACMLRPMLNNSRRGDTVYEPFAGSGTSFVAAEKAGRICLGLELEPRYCDVIIERWQNLVGRQATREPGSADR